MRPKCARAYRAPWRGTVRVAAAPRPALSSPEDVILPWPLRPVLPQSRIGTAVRAQSRYRFS